MKTPILKNFLFVVHNFNAPFVKNNILKTLEVVKFLLFGLQSIRCSLPYLLDDVKIKVVFLSRSKGCEILTYLCFYMLNYKNSIFKKKFRAIYQGYLGFRTIKYL